MTTLPPPSLSNVQLELLKLYATNIPDDTIYGLKKTMAKFFLDKMRQEATKAWVTKKYTDEILEKID
jgi:hypothetical protein